MTPAGRVLRCPVGHSFDLARQGYVSLLTGSGTRLTGDTAEMLSAREKFQTAGHYRPIVEAIGSAVPDDARTIVDVGAGTGYYLSSVLDRASLRRGVGLDVSRAAARHLARCHPRAAGVVADVRQRLPIRTGVADAVLSVFAPRNPAEISRVLTASGVAVVVTPAPNHLIELVSEFGLVRVDPDKAARLAAATAGHLEPVDERTVEFTMHLDAAEVSHLIGMGPSAFHATDTRTNALARIESLRAVTAAVRIVRYRSIG